MGSASPPPAPISAQEFDTALSVCIKSLPDHAPWAVAVSGGPDSMALAFLLSAWLGVHRPSARLHALIVDHALRPESAQEAQHVHETLSAWPNITSTILRWEHPSLTHKLQEEARHARYALMTAYCKTHNIPALFLGHHGDDQAETVLFRLAKGSGLDGLCAMRPVSQSQTGLTLLRPLLPFPKIRLIETCQAHHIPFVQDPSNSNSGFARIRLRQSSDILEKEGLTAKRLNLTAHRLGRARDALEYYTSQAYPTLEKEKDTDRIVFHLSCFQALPEEISLRCLLRAMNNLAPHESYAPRLERCEVLHQDLLKSAPFRKRTLAGVIIARYDQNDEIILSVEASPCLQAQTD